ncbi:MAG: hypothetical protein VYD53_18050 [Pseudomonadota bacterium]|nr:hypothetical protein [Pseudomonadota bacterium]
MSTFTLRPSTQLSFKHVAAATLVLLLIPFIAGLFTAEVNWSVSDFIVMGGLLCITGSALLVTFRYIKRPARFIAASLVLLVFLYSWLELAVGVFFNLGS